MKKTKQTRKNLTSPRSQPLVDRITQGLLWVRKVLIGIILFGTPLLIYLGNTEYGYTKSIFALLTISLLAIVWFAEISLRKSYVLRWTQLFWPGVALLVTGALSLLNLIDWPNLKVLPTFNIGLQTLNLLFYFGFFYFALAHSIENERDAKLFLGCLLISAVPVSIYGILQYYGLAVGAQGISGGIEALISTMGNRNYVGGFLSYLIPPAFILLLLFRQRLVPLLILAVVALFLFTLYIIDSAAVWLGLGLAFFFFVVAVFTTGLKRTISPIHLRWALATVGVLVLAGLVIVTPGLVRLWNATGSQSNAVEKIQAFVGKVWEVNSGETRIWDWWVGYEMWKASPLLGQGLGTYKVKFLEYKVKFRQTPEGQKYNFYIPRAAQAHNEYIQVASEMGTLGLLALLFFIGVLFYTSLQYTARTTVIQEKWILLFILSGIVVFLVDAIFSFPLHLPASALNFVFLLGLLQSKWLRRDLPALTVSSRTFRPIALLGILFVMTVFVVAARDWVSDTCLDAGQDDLRRKLPHVAQGEIECSLEYDFRPTEALAEMGKLYDQLAIQSNKLAKQSTSKAERDKYITEREKYLQKALDAFEEALRVAPNETVYFQIGSLYLQRGTEAKDELREQDATADFKRSEDYFNQLLELQPEELLRLQTLFHRDVLLPLARVSGDPNLTGPAQQLEAISYTNRFIDQYPDYAEALLARAEIYKQLAQAGQTDKCSLANSDYQRALGVLERKRKEAEIKIEGIRSGIRKIPGEFQQLRANLDAYKRVADLIQEGIVSLKKLKC
jgi:O-antigen ligase/chaperonin cofactor prefoldin